MSVSYVSDGDLATPANVNAWLHEAAGERFNVKSFNALGDGATDDTTAIQNTLDAANVAGGGAVTVPTGTYLLSEPLTTYANVRMHCAPDAIMKRSANTSYMLGNSPGVATDYNGGSNIVIQGGVWDAQGTIFTTNMSIFAFAHADNLLISNMTLKNVANWHHVEICACRSVRILDCALLTFTGPVREMLQFDQAGSTGQFPYFTIALDDTPCDDVIVRGCTFRDGSRAIGSHSSGEPHTRIRILGNNFDDLSASAIYLGGSAYENVVISGNTFVRTQRGISIEDDLVQSGDDDSVRSGYIVSNNVFSGMLNPALAYAIRVESTSGSPGLLRGGLIEGNVVDGSALHGIRLSEARGWVVRGNYVNECGTNAGSGTGILLEGSSRCVVAGNTVLGAKHSGIRLTDSPFNLVEGNEVWENERDGILVDNSSGDTSILGNRVEENSQESAGTYDGIRITGDCNNMNIQGNTIRGSVQHQYGLNIETSSCDDAFVVNNDLLDAGASGALNDDGTSTVARDNRGYVTEANGTATLANGATTKVVTHGLGVTPALQDISVTPLEAWGSATQFWISTPTATQFTINVDQDPTQDVDFAWTASVQ